MVTTSKKQLKYNRIAKQAGMTLIELTVVLLILVGLAGLLVPYVGSFNQKTHDSTNAQNLTELNNSFNRYTSENGRLPQHMDSLVNDTTSAAGTGACSGVAATDAGKAYCGLLDTGVFTLAAYPKPVVATPATTDIAYNSLASSKIGMVVNNLTTAPNKTFDSYSKATADMVMISTGMMGMDFKGIKVGAMRDSTGAAVATPTAAQIQTHLAAALGKAPMDYDPGCYDYVVFGLGDANGLVTKTIASAPVHFPEDATKGPVEYYNHYMAVVQVDKSNTEGDSTNAPMGKCTTGTEPAKFLGVVINVPGFPGSKLFGANAGLAYNYDNRAKGL